MKSRFTAQSLNFGPIKIRYFYNNLRVEIEGLLKIYWSFGIRSFSNKYFRGFPLPSTTTKQPKEFLVCYADGGKDFSLEREEKNRKEKIKSWKRFKEDFLEKRGNFSIWMGKVLSSRCWMHAFLMNQKPERASSDLCRWFNFETRGRIARLSQLFSKNLINILMDTWQQPPEMKIIFL